MKKYSANNICILTLLSTIVGATSSVTTRKRSHSSLELQPMSPNPNPYQITYGDGSKSPLIHLKCVGNDETPSHIFEETLDGYAVTLSKKQGGKYTYLDVDMTTGDLIDTELVVGEDNPSSNHVTKQATVKSEVLKESIAHRDFEKGEDRKLLRGTQRKQEERYDHRRTAITQGILKNLVVPIRFADHTSRTLPSRSDLNVLMNHQGYHYLCPTGSVRDVFLKSSFDKLDIDSVVVEWVTIDYTESYCANSSSGLDVSRRFHQCLTNALDKLAASGFDFSNFDFDNDGYMDGMTFFHSGYAAEWGGNDSSGAFYRDRIWSHKWALDTTYWSRNGVRVLEYHVNPSLWSTSGSSIGRIGVVAHETGHFLGLPDLYDYGDETHGDGEGIGSWGLMANSWGFDYSQYYPPHMSAWSKYVLGWVNPSVVSSSGTNYSLRQACDFPDMIMIKEGYPSGEYLLIENRQPCGFEQRMPQGGLAIYHVDENANDILGHPQQGGWPSNGNHYKVALLQADGDYGLERGFNRGDSGDLFHEDGVYSIGPDGTSAGDSYPNTKAYQGGNAVDTEVTITNIPAASASMSFDIMIGSPTDSPTASPSQDESTNNDSWNSKRGIGLHNTAQSCNDLDNHVASTWWYSWGHTAGGFTNSFCGNAASAYNHALNDLDMEFVPMFWGSVPPQPFESGTEISLQDASYLMTFNEPEKPDQANISPKKAAEMWPQITDIAEKYDLELVAPCGTIDGGRTWYREWLSSCTDLYGEPCHYDYTCLHAYFQPYPCEGVDDFACIGLEGSRAMNKIDAWYDEFGKPTWVTEFACNPWGGKECDASLHEELMRQFVPLLDASENVFRYAWFSALSGYFGHSNTNEIIWEHRKGKTCPEKKWIGGFGDAGWQIQSKYECMVAGDTDSDCASPLVLITDDNSCYCAKDACDSPIQTGSWINMWREVSSRDNDTLTSLGELYQTIGSPTDSPTASPTQDEDFLIHFDFYPLEDSDGYDIGNFASQGGVDEFARLCYSDPECNGFNSNGWLKSHIRPRNSWTKWTSNESLGIYVKKSWSLSTSSPTPAPTPAPTQNDDFLIHFDFYPLKDSWGYDIGGFGGQGRGVDDFAEICYLDSQCNGFNSNGWLKYHITPQSDWYVWTSNSSLGIYVKKSWPL